MQEGSRDDATTPQNHNHNAAPNRRRQEGAGSNEELKEKQNKVKLTAVNTMNQILQESGIRKGEI